ncbi:uncharacterized protein LOC143445153 [Clavelina lepadiformis]|uniref:uncharacterized protein LOC143445153 n=1 Tax=Clavelina lepadiformis TaxID=159417 RepID=UPI0040414250
METNDIPTTNDIHSLFDQLESGQTSTQQDVIKKLQAIRLWQLMQQEELKKQQQTQLALLKSQQMPETLSPANSNIETDDVLAIPIPTLQPLNLETVMEKSHDAEGSICLEENEVEVEHLDHVDTHLNGSIQDVDNESIMNYLNEVKIGEDQDEQVNKNSEVKVLEFALQHAGNDSDVSVQDESEDTEEVGVVTEEKSFPCDVETSFEKTSSISLEFDNVPVKGGKTFEEILEEQLKKDKANSMPKRSVASTPKRTFLRKGQGIARFNGPPKRTKFVKKPLAEKRSEQNDSCPVTIKTTHKPPKVPRDKQEIDSYVIKESELPKATSSSKVQPNMGLSENFDPPVIKPRVRKTARLVNREPIKQLCLKPVIVNPPPKPPSVGEVSDEDSFRNESAWSDVEDSVLELDATKGHDETSNETFEQMEKFCNDHYADVSTMNTLEGNDSVIMKKIEPLPPNKLMLSLFPSLRPPNKKNLYSENKKIPAKEVDVKIFKPIAEENKETRNPDPIINTEATSNDDICPSLLKTKLGEMETEIKKFQGETAKLSIVRKEEEEQLRNLKTEFEEFQRQKEDELRRLEEYKKSETKKLKKDRKIFEEHVAAIKSIPNKQDREYIQELEKRILETQEESKTKEQRLTAINNRLRSQLEVATKESSRLTERVKQLEEKLQKIEKSKEIKKKKDSNVVWKAINDIVDSIPNDDENINIDDYIGSAIEKPEIRQVRPKALSKTTRKPLVDRNDNCIKDDSKITMHDGKVERHLEDGSLQISFQNGTEKLVSPDGSTQIKFTNGDIKTISPDQTITYLYTSSGTKHTTHNNGMQVIEFSNKQVERHFPDGSKHISFQDGSSKMIKLDGTEETIYPDGTVMVVTASGEKTIEFSNGQREVHTSQFKRREYPDGTCKTVFSDGRQETRYSSGRLRIKDADGNLLVDKMLSV